MASNMNDVLERSERAVQVVQPEKHLSWMLFSAKLLLYSRKIVSNIDSVLIWGRYQNTNITEKKPQWGKKKSQTYIF